MDVSNLFRPVDEVFTVFVVEKRFAAGNGYEYLHSFINKTNYITTDTQIKKRFSKVFSTIEKNVTPVSDLMGLFSATSPFVPVAEAITSLCKLFTVHEHKAAGPEVIDPIILEEGKITKHMVTKLIHLHKDSIIAPAIIIILKDNDFERAKTMLSDCPHGINIKMISNSGKETVYKVINTGASDISSFIDAFSEQCYNTCSRTRREILQNKDWANNEIVSLYAPTLLKIRSALLFDYKNEIRQELNDLITTLTTCEWQSSDSKKIVDCVLCIAKLFLVFCNDGGGNDLLDARNLAIELNNEILLGHVYRYAEFLPGCTDAEKDDLYDQAYRIFKRNRMVDHAIYSKNNKLVQQFYTNTVIPEEFRNMQEEAINSVPGMVGLSHIYNNVGVAYLYCGNPEAAIDYLKRGLDYAKSQDRIVQRLAIKSNIIIARSYSFERIEEQELYLLLRQIFDSLGLDRLPFLSADYALNILAVSYRQNAKLGEELINEFAVKELIEKSFFANPMGSGERLLQMQCLASRYGDKFPLLLSCKIPEREFLTEPSGKKEDFICRYGYNPSEFNTWL